MNIIEGMKFKDFFLWNLVKGKRDFILFWDYRSLERELHILSEIKYDCSSNFFFSAPCFLTTSG